MFNTSTAIGIIQEPSRNLVSGRLLLKEAETLGPPIQMKRSFAALAFSALSFAALSFAAPSRPFLLAWFLCLVGLMDSRIFAGFSFIHARRSHSSLPLENVVVDFFVMNLFLLFLSILPDQFCLLTLAN